MRDRLRLGIVGGGAAAELCHLPAVSHCPEIGAVTLVDVNRDRAAELAARFQVSDFVTDYRDLFGHVDAVVVALPNYLHAPVAIEFLQKGIPVLVEKPMALTGSDAEAMVAAAGDLPLQVGLMYRFMHGPRIVKQAVEEAWLGNVESVAVEWGNVFRWPVASGSFFSREYSGGGVLVDLGSHMFDLISWVFGDLSLLAYSDDSRGGVEADCSALFEFKSSGRAVQGTLTLSRLRKLSNVFRVVGERLTLEYDVTSNDRIRLWPNDTEDRVGPFVLDVGGRGQSGTDVYAAQLRSFARAVLAGSQPEVPGESGLAVTRLMEQCYRERQSARLPWQTEEEHAMILEAAK